MVIMAVSTDGCTRCALITGQAVMLQEMIKMVTMCISFYTYKEGCARLLMHFNGAHTYLSASAIVLHSLQSVCWGLHPVDAVVGWVNSQGVGPHQVRCQHSSACTIHITWLHNTSFPVCPEHFPTRHRSLNLSSNNKEVPFSYTRTCHLF